jgi:putative membrane protein
MLLRLALSLAWMGALALFIGLIVYQGLNDVLAVLAAAGWGLAWVAAFHLGPLLIDALGWRALLLGSDGRRLSEVTWMRWIGESVNSLLPVAQVGGDLVRVRLLNRAGVPGTLAGASVIVDITAGILTLIIFALLGVALLMQQTGTVQAAAELAMGIAIFGMLLLAFYTAQQAGVFFALARLVERLAKGREWRSLTGGAAALDHRVLEIYRHRRRVVIACVWRLTGWLLGAGEVWLAFYLLGHPLDLSEALILESLAQAVRAAAFAIPGALGVQESGFILLGGMLGVPAETALAASLAKRVRELALGLPGLIAWQLAEGHRVWRQQLSES